MPYYAQLNADGIVCAVSELAGQSFLPNMVSVTSMDSSLLGYKYENGVFSPPPPPPRIVTKVDMLTKRFTMAEFIGIVTASKTDPEVEAWMIIFESAATIDLDSQNTKDGIAMLVSKNLLTQARADEILNGPI